MFFRVFCHPCVLAGLAYAVPCFALHIRCGTVEYLIGCGPLGDSSVRICCLVLGRSRLWLRKSGYPFRFTIFAVLELAPAPQPYFNSCMSGGSNTQGRRNEDFSPHWRINGFTPHNQPLPYINEESVPIWLSESGECHATCAVLGAWHPSEAGCGRPSDMACIARQRPSTLGVRERSAQRMPCRAMTTIAPAMHHLRPGICQTPRPAIYDESDWSVWITGFTESQPIATNNNGWHI
jgi:hypothetical protein